MSIKEATTKLDNNDKQRDLFIKEFAKKIGIKQRPYNFDLVVGTDRFGLDEATAIILKGFELYTKSISRKNKA